MQSSPLATVGRLLLRQVDLVAHAQRHALHTTQHTMLYTYNAAGMTNHAKHFKLTTCTCTCTCTCITIHVNSTGVHIVAWVNLCDSYHTVVSRRQKAHKALSRSCLHYEQEVLYGCHSVDFIRGKPSDRFCAGRRAAIRHQNISPETAAQATTVQ